MNGPTRPVTHGLIIEKGLAVCNYTQRQAIVHVPPTDDQVWGGAIHSIDLFHQQGNGSRYLDHTMTPRLRKLTWCIQTTAGANRDRNIDNVTAQEPAEYVTTPRRLPWSPRSRNARSSDAVPPRHVAATDGKRSENRLRADLVHTNDAKRQQKQNIDVETELLILSCYWHDIVEHVNTSCRLPTLHIRKTALLVLRNCWDVSGEHVTTPPLYRTLGKGGDRIALGWDVHQYEMRDRDNFRKKQHRTTAFQYLPSQIDTRLTNKFPEGIKHLNNPKHFKTQLKLLLVSMASLNSS
ncbi:hypothetical protein J6590_004106 [Homalodisca vitripennis]|nr:hypothetical protein J6590_004106 [Homalodisca vitripennis]